MFPCKFEGDKKGFSFVVCLVVLMLKLQTLDTHRCVCETACLILAVVLTSVRVQLTDCPSDSHAVSDAAGCTDVVCWCILFVIGCILYSFRCNWRRWKQRESTRTLSSMQLQITWNTHTHRHTHTHMSTFHSVTLLKFVIIQPSGFYLLSSIHWEPC